MEETMMNKLLLIPVSCAALLYGVVAQAEREVQFCLAKSDPWTSAQHRQMMIEHGVSCATVYYSLMSPDNRRDPLSWVTSTYLDANLEVVLVLQFSSSGDSSPGLLGRVARGDFDAELQKLIEAIKRANKHVVVRPFHEIDGGWYPWGIYAKGNSVEAAVAAVQHVSRMFREVNAPVSIDINLNRRDGKGKVLGAAEQLIPQIDQWVDTYSISTYNRCDTAPNYRPKSGSGETLADYNRPFGEEFAPVYAKLKAFTDKPVNVAETSTSGRCAARIPWFKEMLESVDAQFPDTHTVTFVFGDVAAGKAANDVPIQWGFQTAAERREFRKLLRQYQARQPVPVSGRATRVAAEYRMPWQIWGQMTGYTSETSNPALNPVTGEEFGKEKTVLHLTASQRLLYPLNERYEVGPGIRLGGIASPNDNQWWNNQVSAEVSLGLYQNFDTEGSIAWGGWSVEVFAGRKHYTSSAPVRYNNNNDDRVGVRVGVNFGGDWTK